MALHDTVYPSRNGGGGVGGNVYGSVGFCHWMTNIKMSRLIVLVLACLFAVSLIVHYSLPSSGDKDDTATHRTRDTLEAHGPDLTRLKFNDLKFQIEELKRIKASVNNELRDLESKRQKLHSEITHYNTQIEMLKNDFEKGKWELDQLRVTIENTKVEKAELEHKREPLLTLPRRVLPSISDSVIVSPPMNESRCRMYNCFDWSRCSLSSGFPVYLYSTEEESVVTGQTLDTFIKLSVNSAVDASGYRTYDPHTACLFVVLVGDSESGLHHVSTQGLAANLAKLPYWRGDGRNHLLVNLARSPANQDVFFGVSTGRAMIGQSTFLQEQFRTNYDLVLPPSLGISYGDVWDQIPKLVPAHRTHLVSFQGEYVVQKQGGNSDTAVLEEQETFMVKALKSLQVGYPDDKLLFQFSCDNKGEMSGVGSVGGEWALCGTSNQRQEVLKKSTFTLIPAAMNYSVLTTTVIQIRIFEAMQFGAIPVVIGDQLEMPFSELLSWQLASVTIPKSRAEELLFLLRTFSDADVLEMRRRGRIFWETYFGTTRSIVTTALAAIRERLHIPPRPIPSEPAPSVFNASFVPLRDPNPLLAGAEQEQDVLGPVESPFPSPQYYRNFSYNAESYNEPRHPFHLFPSTPFEPVLPAEAKFLGKCNNLTLLI